MNTDYPRTLLGIVELAASSGWHIDIRRWLSDEATSGWRHGMSCTLIPHSSIGYANCAYIRWRAGADGRWRLHAAGRRDLTGGRTSETVTLAAIRDLLRTHRIGGTA